MRGRAASLVLGPVWLTGATLACADLGGLSGGSGRSDGGDAPFESAAAPDAAGDTPSDGGGQVGVDGSTGAGVACMDATCPIGSNIPTCCWYTSFELGTCEGADACAAHQNYDFACSDSAGCAAQGLGPVCCAHQDVAGDLNASSCAASCSGQSMLQLCSSTSDCTPGYMCTPNPTNPMVLFTCQ
jgi:hypothetical protein